MKSALKTGPLKGCMFDSLHIQIIPICVKNKQWEVFSLFSFNVYHITGHFDAKKYALSFV